MADPACRLRVSRRNRKPGEFLLSFAHVNETLNYVYNLRRINCSLLMGVKRGLAAPPPCRRLGYAGVMFAGEKNDDKAESSSTVEYFSPGRRLGFARAYRGNSARCVKNGIAMTII